MNRSDILKVKDSRKHSIRNSLGIYDAYKYIRKNKWFNIERPLKEHEFYSIIRTINNYLIDYFLDNKPIIFPQRMGMLELRKYPTRIEYKNNKLVTNLPIDWDSTLKLWCEDETAYKEKTLVKMEEKELFRIYYNKQSAIFNNKGFYSFKVNRDLKIKVKQRIKDGVLDAYLL